MLTFSAKTWRYFDCLREMCEESEGARVSTRLVAGAEGGEECPHPAHLMKRDILSEV